MKYKEGDKVRIKSIDWYNENKDEYGDVWCGAHVFTYGMSKFCGKIVTIFHCYAYDCYTIKDDDKDYTFTDDMIEGLVDEIEITRDIKAFSEGYDHGYADGQHDINEWILPEGFEFYDENGNVINATKVVLKKKSPKTDDIIKWLREHDMTKYIGVLYTGICSITFDTEKLIKDITETIEDK